MFKTRSIHSTGLTEKEIRWYKENYVFAEEMDSEQVLRGIEDFMQHCDVEKSIFIFQIYAKGANSCVFDEKLQQFCLKKEKRTCSSLIPRSSEKATRLGIMMLALKNVLKKQPTLINQFHYDYP